MMSVYVVTRGTSDFPGDVVLRRHTMEHEGLVADTLPLAIAKTVIEVRRFIPPNLTRFDPVDLDDPVIVEFWA